MKAVIYGFISNISKETVNQQQQGAADARNWSQGYFVAPAVHTYAGDLQWDSTSNNNGVQNKA